MGGEWTEARLGDVIEVKHGWPFKSELFTEKLSGRPIVVNIGNFRYTGGFRFDSTTVREYRGDYPSEYELSPGEILIVMTCQTSGGEILGIPARVPRDGKIYLHNQRLGRVVVKNPARVNADYLYWMFLSPSFNRELFLSATGTKILHTAPSRIEAVRIQLPDLSEQRAIANVLGALDDRINLNRRTNETLEAMARALFKSWFVDFDAVRAKIEGRDTGLPKALAGLFPDSFEDSELGEIPKGWRVGGVGELATLSRDSINPATFAEETFDLFSIPAFDEGRRPKAERGVMIKSNKFLVPGDAVLISKLNPRIPRIWLPLVGGSHRAICSTEFLVTLPRAGSSREFLYGLLSSDALVDVFATLATGTSGSHQRVRSEGLLTLDTVIPSVEAIDRYTAAIRPLLRRVSIAQGQTDALVALRDTLLPRLISGQLRIPEVESAVALVV